MSVDVIIGKKADGTDEIASFPDGMPPEQIEAALKQRQESLTPAQETAVVPLSKWDRFLQGQKDPNIGVMQLLHNIAGTASKGTEAVGLGGKSVTEFAAGFDDYVGDLEAEYQKQLKAGGHEGVDWMRMLGTATSPLVIYSALRLGGMGVTKAVDGLKNVAKFSPAGAAAAGAATSLVTPEPKKEDSDSFWESKVKRGAVDVPLSVVGGKLVHSGARALSPIVEKTETVLRDFNISQLPGQLIGGRFKDIENFAKNLPLVGNLISNRAEKQLFEFNTALFDNVLSSIGAKAPKDVVGRTAIKEVTDVVEKNIDSVLKNVSLNVNSSLLRRLNSVWQKKPTVAFGVEEQATVKGIADDLIARLGVVAKNGKIDGSNYKELDRLIGEAASRYGKSGETPSEAIYRSLLEMKDKLRSSLLHQNKDNAKALFAADTAKSRLYVLQEAARNSDNGVITPNAFKDAVEGFAVSSKQTQRYATGGVRDQELAEAAASVMRVNQGTNMEGIWMARAAAAAGTGTAAIYSPAAILPVWGSFAALYSPLGTKAAEKMLSQRPELLRAAGQSLSTVASPVGGMFGTLGEKEFTRTQRR